jgi:hypothetical protein
MLTCLPCTDIVLNDSKKISDISISKYHHDSDDEHDYNTCTPFCHCACCGVSVIIQDFCFWKPKLFLDSNFVIAKNFYAKQIVEEVYINIWQPPKLIA